MAQLMSIKRNVEMCPGQVSVPAIYHVSQGDKGTRIILGLVNNSANYTIPEGTTATIRGHRADGTLFTEITADVETTEVKFNLTEDMSAIPGRAECEAVLASGSANIIGTANFIIDVEKSPASIGSVFPGTDAATTWLIDELTNLDLSSLDDESVVDAINSKANESTIAPEFDSSASYTAGQMVLKNGVLYRFTSDHTGAWTGSDAEVVTVGGEVEEVKGLVTPQLYGNAGADFPISFENGTYYSTATGQALQKYYGGGYDLTRKVIKTTTFNAPCKVVITAKTGYAFTVFTSANGVITGNTGLITSYVMTPGNQYGMTLRTTGGTDNISALDASQIIDVKYINNISESVAPEFSASAIYVKGQYVYKDGILYIFTSDHTGSWSDADAEIVTVGREVTNLKADLNNQYIKEFYEIIKSPNMIDGEESLTTGYMAKTGSVDHTVTNMCYTDFIPVSEGDIVRAYQIDQGVFSNRHLRMMCCFNANKAVMSAVGNNNDIATFTVPAGVAYIRPTLYDSASITGHMLTLNYEATKYEPYGEQHVITKDFLTIESQNAVDALVNNAYTRKLVSNRYACGAPKQGLKMTIELQQPWYIDSLISQPFLSIDIRAAGDHRRYADRVEFTCSTAKEGQNGYAFRMYDEVFGSMLRNVNEYAPAGYGLPVKWVNENLSDCTLLAIGDSTVDQDVMTAKILSLFTEQGHTITLLGTLGSGLNRNEGRAGWSAKDYLTNRQYEGTVNPFYNPTTQTFDFSYYMTNQGYSAPDFVVIQLGINDLYNLAYANVPAAIETTWNAIKTMIDSILAYSSSIKIILNLPTAPKDDISVHTNFLPLYKNTRVLYNEYAQEQVRAYNESKVRVSYCHLILNSNDIYDTVHPNSDGYEKMAKEIVSQINVWQN